jgi:hypothetical protein
VSDATQVMVVSIAAAVAVLAQGALSLGSGGASVASLMVTVAVGLLTPGCGYVGAKRRDKCARRPDAHYQNHLTRQLAPKRKRGPHYFCVCWLSISNMVGCFWGCNLFAAFCNTLAVVIGCVLVFGFRTKIDENYQNCYGDNNDGVRNCVHPCVQTSRYYGLSLPT